MPLPMVHFSVAVEYFEHRDIPSAFLLGSIAPDAIHMRRDTNREDKKRTHLHMEGEPNLPEYARNRYEHYISQSPDEEWKWFVKGYFAHLLTDHFWLLDVHSVFKERTELDGLTKDETRKSYYRDTDQIDFTFYRTKPWVQEVWSGLIGARSFAFEPLLTADEIHYWRFRTVHWFDLLSKEPGGEPRYITQQMVESFIPDAGRRIKAVLTDWERRAEGAGQHVVGGGL